MARAVKDRARWHAVDPGAAKDLARIAAYGPGDPDFGSPLGDRKAIAYFERDNASGEFVLLDREVGTVRPLYVQRKSLAFIAVRVGEVPVARATSAPREPKRD
jgi:hypothetical protein